MRTIKLVATATNPRHATGVVYEAAPIQAAADTYQGHAVYYVEPPAAPGKRQTYKRRDLTAEKP